MASRAVVRRLSLLPTYKLHAELPENHGHLEPSAKCANHYLHHPVFAPLFLHQHPKPFFCPICHNNAIMPYSSEANIQKVLAD